MENGLTLKGAAQHLSVTDRTIRNYISRGFLSTFKKRGDRKLWIPALEVEELRRDRAEGTDPITKRAFLEMRAEVRRLRFELDVVLRILDAKMEPLRMSKEYAEELFTVCSAQLQNSSWSYSEMAPWVEIFLRLDEEDLKTISDATKSMKPWKPFMQLCAAMATAVVSNPMYETSLDLQGVHRQLAEGRRRLRISALIFVETHSVPDSDVDRYARGIPESVTNSLEKILSGKNGRRTGHKSFAQEGFRSS